VLSNAIPGGYRDYSFDSMLFLIQGFQFVSEASDPSFIAGGVAKSIFASVFDVEGQDS
jgi:hypothetical protein